MKHKTLILASFLIFLLIIGCSKREEQKISEKPSITSVQKQENIENEPGQQAIDGIASTKGLDSALEELDLME